MFETIAWISIIIGFVVVISISLAAMLIARRREQNVPKPVDYDEAVGKVDAAADAALNEMNRTAELILRDIDEKYQSLLFLYDLMEDKYKKFSESSARRERIAETVSSAAKPAGVPQQLVRQGRAQRTASKTPEPVQYTRIPIRRSHGSGASPSAASSSLAGASPSAASSPLAGASSAAVSSSVDSFEAAAPAEVSPGGGLPAEAPAEKSRSINEKHEQIIELHNQGIHESEIARILDMGKGEVKLIIDLKERKKR